MGYYDNKKTVKFKLYRSKRGIGERVRNLTPKKYFDYNPSSQASLMFSLVLLIAFAFMAWSLSDYVNLVISNDDEISNATMFKYSGIVLLEWIVAMIINFIIIVIDKKVYGGVEEDAKD